MNLIAAFLESAERAGDKTALVAGFGESVSFAELARRSGRLAAGWRAAGLGRGDRVLLAMPIGVNLYVAIAALWRLGATIVFPEPAFGLAGVERAIEIARPRALAAAGIYRLLPLLVRGVRRIPLRLGISAADAGDPLETLPPGHPALISFTGGSTGRPKGIERSHGFLAAQDAALRTLMAPSREDETDLIAFPVFVLANLAAGVTSVLPYWRQSRNDRVDPSRLATLIGDRGITRALIPPVLAEVLAKADGLSLEAVFTGGGPVFPDLLQRLSTRLPSARLISVYGSTEAEPIAAQAAGEISPEQWVAMMSKGGLLAGRPIPGIAVKILDDEIIVAGPHVNKGYIEGAGDAENKLRLDGQIWHRTGDAGRLDADGTLWLRGRLSARAGGLYPFEVEPAARAWPGVVRAALLPESDPATLAVEGREPRPGLWRELGEKLGIATILPVRIPLDRRHRSKVDYVALRRLARQRTP